MRKNNLVKFFSVIIVIGLLTYITNFGLNVFGLYIPGAKDIRLGIDINGGIDAALFAIKQDGSKPTQSELDSARISMGKRLDAKGIVDRDITTDANSGSIIIRIPWKADEKDFNPQKAIDELGRTALLTFQEVDEDKKDDKGDYLPTGRIVIQGTQVKDTGVATDSKTGSVVVELELNSEGAKDFEEATGRLVGKRIAIFMDEQFISAPMVNERIPGGKAMINGQRDVKEATELAGIIKSGALPFKLEAKQVNSISPLLGKGALDVSIKAGIVAFILVCLFMVLYYRLPGLIACVVLLSQVMMQILAISWPQFTLTLPGIAGIILSIGMSVDANVITAERIKEEIKSGKTLRAAVDAGFDRAFSSIFDGNITVLIVAVVLYIFGTGSMFSFAYTLGIGVLFNFVNGVTFSRILIKSVSNLDAAKKHWLYGA